MTDEERFYCDVAAVVKGVQERREKFIEPVPVAVHKVCIELSIPCSSELLSEVARILGRNSAKVRRERAQAMIAQATSTEDMQGIKRLLDQAPNRGTIERALEHIQTLFPPPKKRQKEEDEGQGHLW